MDNCVDCEPTETGASAQQLRNGAASSSPPFAPSATPTLAATESNQTKDAETPTGPTAKVALPRVIITFCTQCRWMLRAAYFAQELLSTFGNSLGEVSLRPATGGLFRVDIVYEETAQQGAAAVRSEKLLWERKRDGGFPEAKVLKQLVRDCVDPGRGLGHSDRNDKKEGASGASG